MIILRSTGPRNLDAAVLQIGGIGATVHADSRMDFVSGKKSGFSPASRRFWRSHTLAACQFHAPAIKPPLQLNDKFKRGRRKHPLLPAGCAGAESARLGSREKESSCLATHSAKQLPKIIPQASSGA